MFRRKEMTSSGSTSNLQMVIDEAPCTISWVKKDLTYIGVNKGLADICGVSQKEFAGKPVGFYTNEKYFYTFVEKLFATSNDRLEEELQGTIDGENRWYFIVGRKYNQGQEAVLIGIDITAQKRAELQMIFNEKMATLGELAANIAHEINSPLSVIMLRSEALKNLNVTDPKIRTELTEISEKLIATGERINKIIMNLKGFSRDSTEDPFERMSLEKIIRGALDLCERKLYHSGTQITVTGPNHLEIDCKEVELTQVLVNLVSNAVDAIAELESKWIKIETVDLKTYLDIRVIDSGSGIPEKVREKMFQPFFSTKGKGKGTGLGLSISRAIIEKHGGQFYVDPKHPNTCFVIKIPQKQTSRKVA